jgi:hypothetical protein
VDDEELPNLGLGGWQVSLIYIDFAFGLVFEPPEPGGKTARARIEMPFELRDPDGSRHRIEPGPPQSSVAPALRLHNQTVLDASVSADGTLGISFKDGSALRVTCDPNYEAWDITGPAGKMICVPGGEVAYWPVRSDGSGSD